MMELKNYMEDLVASYIDEAAKKDKDFCNCPKCRLDAIALALNALKPKYVVTDKGYAYARIGELEAQYRTDVIVETTKAMQQVKSRPRH